jgi:hypothetical protein
MNHENNPERESALAHLRMQQDNKTLYAVKWIAMSEKLIEEKAAEKARILALVRDYLDHVPDENEYLRRKGDELLRQIRGADTGGDRQGATTPGVAGEQTDTDDFEWEPRSDCS